MSDVWACVYTAESELRPAKCASQYIRQLFVVCLSFDVAIEEAEKEHRLKPDILMCSTLGHPVYIHSILPSIACNTICFHLSSSSPVQFPAMRLPNGIRSCFTFTYSCFTVSHPSTAFTATFSHKLPIVDNSYAHVHFTSLLTAEPEP